MYWRRCVIFLFAVASYGTIGAQGGFKGFVKKIGATLDSMSVRGLDSRYIEAPEKPWQVILRHNVNQTNIGMTATGNLLGLDYKAKPNLRTEPAHYVGIWAGYRGYGFGYTLNVAGDKGSYLTFGMTGSSYGINLRIHSFKNDHPNFDIESDIDLDFDDTDDTPRQMQLRDPIRVHTVFADGYYLFNGKRFSHAAAYDQSVIQKRSAGSLMAGAMFYYGRIDYAAPSNAELIYIMHGLGRIKLWQGSVGVGYAYNWVPTKGLLVSVMAMPMLTFVNRLKAFGYTTNIDDLINDPTFLDDDLTDEEWDNWWYDNLRISPSGNKTFNSGVTVNFDARLSLTYNFGRYFVNAYGQWSNMRYRHTGSHGHLNDWFINASVGVRL